MKGFTPGDPRAVAAGRRGGRSPKRLTHRRTLEYTKGYAAGWIACQLNQARRIAVPRREKAS